MDPYIQKKFNAFIRALGNEASDQESATVALHHSAVEVNEWDKIQEELKRTAGCVEPKSSK